MIEPVELDPRQLPQGLAQLAGSLADTHTITERVTSSRPARQGSRRAAVLILLGEQDHDLTFTERAGSMRTHAGQMSFPGGSMDPGETVVQTALREAQEEIALEPSQARVLGRLPPAHVAASGFDVAGIVALWSGAEPIHPVDPREVEAIHRYRVDELADPANRVSARLPTGYRGPAFVFDEIMVWGFTAHLVDCVLDLGGWARPWDRSRELDVPWRFLRHGPTSE